MIWLFIFSVLYNPLSRADTNVKADIVERAIVFLYSADANGNADERKPLATGFLVLAPMKGSISTGVLVLITARHVVDPAWAFCSQPQPNLIYARLNKKNYDPEKDSSGVEYLPVPLRDGRGNKLYTVRDDDDKVDAAVISVGGPQSLFSQDKYNILPMRLSLFASPDEIKSLGIGSSIVSAGLIPGRSGEKRNYPFFKFGEISSIPDEPVWIGCGGKVELRLERVWFVAANLLGGNSGSPVLYAPPTLRVGSIARGIIIGVQSSSFDGADVAGMAPIEDVFEILEKNMPPGIDLYRGDEATEPK